MENRKNIYIISINILKEGGILIYRLFQSLFSGKQLFSGGIWMSLLHHILTVGPRAWKKYPTAITLGRALFSPFVFLFSQSGRIGNSQKK